MLKNFDLFVIWRIRNPKLGHFTFRRNHFQQIPFKKQLKTISTDHPVFFGPSKPNILTKGKGL